VEEPEVVESRARRIRPPWEVEPESLIPALQKEALRPVPVAVPLAKF
jgi:hypothetical protein